VLVKITSKRQVTFPAHVLETMGLRSGDYLELLEGPEGFLLRPRRIDFTALAPLRHKLVKGVGTFELDKFRAQPHDPTLRD